MANVLCHQQDIRSCRKWSWWHSVIYILSHPNELASGCIASRWLMVNVGCHPDKFSCCPMSSIRDNIFLSQSHPDDLAICSISSGWLIDTAWCHPDHLRYCPRMTLRHLNRKSSGWLSPWPYVIRMPYGHCSISLEWFTIFPKSSG